MSPGSMLRSIFSSSMRFLKRLRTLRQTVTDYCDNMLKTTEEAMVENAAQVKNVRANLRQNAKKNG